MEIKRIRPKSFGKILAVTYAVFGFIGGLFFLVIAIGAQNGSDTTGAPPIIFGLAAPIALPLLYGVFGFLTGVIGAWIYNVAAKRVGGIEIETD